MNTIYLFIDSSFIFVNCNFSNVIDKATNEIKDIAKWRFIQQFLTCLSLFKYRYVRVDN